MMIGFAANQLAEGAHNDPEKRLRATHTETLSLVRLLQQRLHAEVNPLLQLPDLTDQQKQQLNLLVQRQLQLLKR